jgi:hypothetical protein
MTLDASGRLLVGTTSNVFGERLTVNNWITAGDLTRVALMGQDGTNVVFGAYSNHNLVLRTDNTTRLTIASTGAATFSSSVTANASTNFTDVSTSDVGNGVLITSNGVTAGAGAFGGGLVFSAINGSSRRAAIVPVQGTADNDTVGLAFFTHPSASGSNPLVEAMRINYLGSVGIGTTSPAAKLEIFGTGNTLRLDSAVNGAKTILLRNVGTATAEIKTDGNLDFNIEDANRTMRFLTSNTERMRITSDGYARLSTNSLGIQFNGDTAAANALDDYEEGTFTPGLTFGGSSTGMTFFDRAGVYTKIGRQVSCTIYLALTAKGSSTGEAILTGLPFTNGNYNRGSQSPASIRFDSITYTGTLQPYLANSSSGIRFQYVTEAGSDTTVTNSNFTDGAEMSITVTYFV